MKTKILLLNILLGSQILSAQKTLVFFGSFNWSKSKKGIYVYELNEDNGKLKRKSAIKGVINPSFLTLSENGEYLYACTESKTENAGSVSSFRIDSKNNSIKYLNSQKTDGENPVYLQVHPSGKWLVNGNYTEGSISVYPIRNNGKIEAHVQNLHFDGQSIDPKRQEASHIHSTVFTDDGKFLVAADLGTDELRLFKFDASKDKPLQDKTLSTFKTKQGVGPRHIIFHPNQKWAYCIEEMGGSISVYDFDNGELNSKQRIETHDKTVVSPYESSDIHISPDGQFLYASNRGKENNIAIFKIDKNGLLSSIGYQETLGKHPRIFGLDPSGNYLIVTHTNGGKISVFKRDSTTGLLKIINSKVKIKNASSVVMHKY